MAGRIANPGSKLGEAIGAAFEAAGHRVLARIATKHGLLLRTHGAQKKGKDTQLLIQDRNGNAYRIDGVIVNRANQPLALIETKYIRYKKHNRDKASWICNTHTAIRQTYPTIRKAMALLAGQWSAPSREMMRTYGIDLYEVSWLFLVKLLDDYGINLLWEEDDKDAVMVACLAWMELTDEQVAAIGDAMIETIREQLETELEAALTGEFKPAINKVEVHVKTDRFTTFVHEFKSTKDAEAFLTNYKDSALTDFATAPPLWEANEDALALFPEIFEEEDCETEEEEES